MNSNAIACIYCSHKKEGDGLTHCKLFANPPTRPCVHNTNTTEVGRARRLIYVETLRTTSKFKYRTSNE